MFGLGNNVFTKTPRWVCWVARAATHESPSKNMANSAGMRNSACYLHMWLGSLQIKIAKHPKRQTQGCAGYARLVSIPWRIYLSFYCPLGHFWQQVTGQSDIFVIMMNRLTLPWAKGVLAALGWTGTSCPHRNMSLRSGACSFGYSGFLVSDPSVASLLICPLSPSFGNSSCSSPTCE